MCSVSVCLQCLYDWRNYTHSSSTACPALSHDVCIAAVPAREEDCICGGIGSENVGAGAGERNRNRNKVRKGKFDVGQSQEAQSRFRSDEGGKQAKVLPLSTAKHDSMDSCTDIAWNACKNGSECTSVSTKAFRED